MIIPMKDENGVVYRWCFKMDLAFTNRSKKHEIGRPKFMQWIFDLSNTILQKVTTMVPDYYDHTDLATEWLDSGKITWMHRDTPGVVSENRGLVGDIIIHHDYIWHVPSTLQDTLADELEFDGTLYVPTDRQMPPRKEWEEGYTKLYTQPDHFDELDSMVKTILKQAGLLQYVGPNDVMSVNDSYKQFTHILHGHLGKGQRKPLPGCILEGVRTLFPDEKGQYVGYKDK